MRLVASVDGSFFPFETTEREKRRIYKKSRLRRLLQHQRHGVNNTASCITYHTTPYHNACTIPYTIPYLYRQRREATRPAMPAVLYEVIWDDTLFFYVSVDSDAKSFRTFARRVRACSTKKVSYFASSHGDETPFTRYSSSPQRKSHQGYIHIYI